VEHDLAVTQRFDQRRALADIAFDEPNVAERLEALGSATAQVVEHDDVVAASDEC
jgi:hypothetical protein